VKPKDWGAFALLGCIWGSSFLWIKIAVQELDPFTLVGWRLLFGLVGMVVVVGLVRPTFPRGARSWVFMAILGITNTALPFVLISWGEKTIDSGVASILNSTVPLFTLLVAHLFLHDDRITLPKVLGLLTGFAGVIVLLLRDLQPGSLSGSLLGQAAVILGAIAYAGSSVFARRTMREVSPMVQAFVPMVAADASVWAVATQAGNPGRLPSMPLTWVALLWLGLLGSCTAYLLYYHLLHSVGATRTTMVTYVFPVVGVALGVLFLREQADWHLLVGALLVVAGIGVVNLPARPALVPTPAAD
jgi:drug/metabolite transporter (DMT)-like permease